MTSSLYAALAAVSKLERAWCRYFESRYLDLELKKINVLKEVAAVPHLARKVETIYVRCVDNSKLLQTETTKLSILTTLAIQSFRNLVEVIFIPSASGINDLSGMEDDEPFIDFSETYSIVLFAIQTCGLRPNQIGCKTIDSWLGLYGDVNMGIGTCPEPSSLKECYSALRTFQIDLQSPVETRHRLTFAKDFAHCVNLMQSLTILSITSFGYGDATAPMEFVMSTMSEDLYLPCLETIELKMVKCRIQDLNAFLSRHARTIASCQSLFIAAVETNASSLYRNLLKMLRDEFHLESLEITDLEDSDFGLFDFPKVECAYSRMHEIDDGWIEVQVQDEIRLHGQQEIGEGLADMLESMIRV